MSETPDKFVQVNDTTVLNTGYISSIVFKIRDLSQFSQWDEACIFFNLLDGKTVKGKCIDVYPVYDESKNGTDQKIVKYNVVHLFQFISVNLFQSGHVR